MTSADTTLTLANWYPVAARLPDGVALQKCRLVLARGGGKDGLWLYQQPVEDAPTWRAEHVDWARTGPLPTERQAARGVDIWLEDGGLVVATYGGACSRCGPMGRWAGPVWSHTVVV